MGTYVKSYLINSNFVLVIVYDNKIFSYHIKISYLGLFIEI